MTQLKNKIKLQQVLERNRKWATVIIGASTADFDGVVISANIDEHELHNANAPWVKELSGKPLLIIEGLDRLGNDAQEKFVGLLKDKRIGSYKLPDTIQIVIPVQTKEKVFAKIQGLTLSWEMK